MSQVLEKNTDYDTKDREKTYKTRIENEKEKAAKIQETLTQVLTEKEEKVKQLLAIDERHHKLEESYHKLEENYHKLEESNRALLCQKQSTEKQLQNKEKQLEEVLRQLQVDKKEYELHIKDIQKEKIDKETDKGNATKAQEALKHLSDELQKKKEKNVAIEQNYHKLLCKNQSTEKQLQDVTEQYNASIKELEACKLENENTTKKLLTEITNTKKNQLALQDKNTSLLQEKENLKSDIKRLQDENNTLKVASKELDRQVLEKTKNIQSLAQSEQKATAIEQEAMLQELAESKEKYRTLEKNYAEILNEKQKKELSLKDLQKALEQSQSEIENLQKKLQQKEKLRELSPLDDTQDELIVRSSILLSSEESYKKCSDDEGDPTSITTTVKAQVTKNSIEQLKDELAGPHAELSIVDQFPVKNTLAGNNQLTTMKKAIVKDQSTENTIKDHITETPTSYQLTGAPEKGQLTQTLTVHQTPENDLLIKPPAKNQFTEASGNDHLTVVPDILKTSTEDQHTKDHNIVST